MGNALEPIRSREGRGDIERDSIVVLDVRVVAGTGGGPDKTILNSPRFLAGTGYRMLCAYLHPPEDPGFEQLRHKAKLKAAPLISISDRGPLDWQILPRLVERCQRDKVAIWHGHDYKSNVLGVMVRRFWPMRMISTVHGWVGHTRRTPLYYWLDRLSLRFYEKVLCVSEDLYRVCRDNGVAAQRCEVLENGIDLEEFTRTVDLTEAKRRLGIDSDQLIVGAVGRLAPEKGFNLLIQAVHHLCKNGINVAAVIAGEGEERPRLEQVIAQLGMKDRVRLLGYQSDLRDWYQAMDVFALSSLREGLPNVLLESMALEVPVVATNVAGVPRLVQEGKTGLMVESGNVRALVDGLTRVLTDAGLRTRLAIGGRRLVESHYNFVNRMDRLRRIYDRMLNRSTRTNNT